MHVCDSDMVVINRISGLVLGLFTELVYSFDHGTTSCNKLFFDRKL